MDYQLEKYARFEFERRFLLEGVPAGVPRDGGWRISDRYIRGTRLRLREMMPLGVGEAIYKIGRKDVPAPPDFSRVAITNIYLTPEEHEVFQMVPADELCKLRYSFRHDGFEFAIDVFEGSWDGLVLAEMGFENAEEMSSALPPEFAFREVSSDIRFTGGALAAASTEDASNLIALSKDTDRL